MRPAVAEALAEDGLDENSAAIVAFQRRLIAERETGRQLMSSALRPPAVAPACVLQSGGARSGAGGGGVGGFWRRLFGRG